MKVLVADKFEQRGLDALTAMGCQVSYQPDAVDQALADAVRTTGAAVLVVRSTKVPAAVLDAGSLALIVRAGAGVNTIDVAGASVRSPATASSGCGARTKASRSMSSAATSSPACRSR